MGNKLIKNVDDILWRKFTKTCIKKDKRVSNELSKLIKNYLEEDKKNAS